MANTSSIDNSFYDTYGERWYTAKDDPVALLRAENKIQIPWVLERVSTGQSVLDVGCGAGFLANQMALEGLEVKGIDLSAETLEVARRHDETRSVDYRVANAYSLPFKDASFDVVCAMDFLEHVENPDVVIREISRVLRANGKFFFHTFNRNWLSWLVAIKTVEWLLPKTPKNMHVLKLFITPHELRQYCQDAGLLVHEMTGIRPVLSSFTLRNVFEREVPASFRFELTRSTRISYMGMAIKEGPR